MAVDLPLTMLSLGGRALLDSSVWLAAVRLAVSLAVSPACVRITLFRTRMRISALALPITES
jgi:hypothetical protein